MLPICCQVLATPAVGSDHSSRVPLLEFIRSNPGLTPTKIRDLAPKDHPNLRLSGISDAVKAIHERGDIQYKKGPRGARLWEVAE